MGRMTLVSRGAVTASAVRDALLTLALYTLLGLAAAHAGVPDGCETKLGAPVADFTQPVNLDLVKRQLLYYRCTRYDIDVALVLRDAKRWIAKRAPEVAKAGGKPAIVFDIDETALSNWKRIHWDDFAYIRGGACDFKNKDEACGDDAWEESAQAPAIEPTLRLYSLARCESDAAPPGCAKIDVFFVTGRKEIAKDNDTARAWTSRDWTLRNLERAGYHGVDADHLYMRDPHSSGPVAVDKTTARAAIEGRGYVIIANIGDQESDLVGGHSERTFKVPNPFYFIP
jgi:hypothetical protein